MDIQYCHLDVVDSTIFYAKQFFSKIQKNLLICVSADSQTNGQGQRGKSWISPPGKNISMTFVFQLPPSPIALSNLAQVGAISFATLLEKEGLTPSLKWPNDILLSNKKVAGTLCETNSSSKSLNVFLSIGVNVNATAEDLVGIDQPATSLSLETNKLWDRKELSKTFANHLCRDLELLETTGFAPFRSSFERILHSRGKIIRCLVDGQEHAGSIQRVTEDGRLLVKFLSSQQVALLHSSSQILE